MHLGARENGPARARASAPATREAVEVREWLRGGALVCCWACEALGGNEGAWSRQPRRCWSGALGASPVSREKWRGGCGGRPSSGQTAFGAPEQGQEHVEALPARPVGESLTAITETERGGGRSSRAPITGASVHVKRRATCGSTAPTRSGLDALAERTAAHRQSSAAKQKRLATVVPKWMNVGHQGQLCGRLRGAPPGGETTTPA